jgi:hypothetical protein
MRRVRARAIAQKLSFPPLSLFAKVELTASFLQALIIIGLQSAIAGVFANTVPGITNDPTQGNYKSITVYLVLFILSQVYQFALVVNAVRSPTPVRVCPSVTAPLRVCVCVCVGGSGH